MEHAWHHLGKDDVLEKLKTSRHGLTDDDAKARREKNGPNTLPSERPVPAVVLIVRQIKSSLVFILLGAAAISFALQDFVDAQVILAAVVLNVVVGFVQEQRAQNALLKLRQVVRFHALVIRNGESALRRAEDLVPGDIIELTTGSRVPADARLLTSVGLAVNEAALTGESFPVPKGTKRLPAGAVPLADRTNMVYLGTTIAQGSGVAVVTATGQQTEIGAIATMLKTTIERPTPLQDQLRVFSRWLGTAIVIIALALFLFGVAVGKPLTEIFTVSVAVAVAAIPEGLLVAVTVILAIGMQRILRHKALVRKLVAAETLGSTTVICTDKTGTLTEGEMSVVRIITEGREVGFDHVAREQFGAEHENATVRNALEIGLLCNDAHIEHENKPLEHRVVTGNPTERALVFASHAVGYTRAELEKRFPRLDTIPFDSERKYMATLHAPEHGEHLVFVKGAPEWILPASTAFDRDGQTHRLTPERSNELEHMIERMSSEGLRVIAVARRNVPRDKRTLAELGNPVADLTFVALIGMKDPLRREAAETVKRCRDAGIRIVMITGDHKLTAQRIAEELGLPANAENVIDGEEFAALSEYDLEQRIRAITVYARVSPKDKLRIITAWQAKGEVVAMTGDGVNDAPALKAADIGVALGSGTDVAKEAADVVLLDNNVRTIVAAVEQGRVIYENIRKVVLYLLTDSFSEVILVAVSLFATLLDPDFPLPLLAAQILWINLVTDGLPNIALTVEPEEREIMNDPPRDPRQALVTPEIRWMIGVVSVVSAGAAFLLFLWYWQGSGNLELARTVAFASLGVDSLFYVFSVRSLRHAIFNTSIFLNRALIAAVLGGLVIQVMAVYFGPLQRVLGTVALGVGEWAMVAVASLLTLTAVEIVKAVFRQRRTV